MHKITIEDARLIAKLYNFDAISMECASEAMNQDLVARAIYSAFNDNIHLFDSYKKVKKQRENSVKTEEFDNMLLDIENDITMYVFAQHPLLKALIDFKSKYDSDCGLLEMISLCTEPLRSKYFNDE